MPGYWLRPLVHPTRRRKRVQCSAEISLDEPIKFICDLQEGHEGPHIAWDPDGYDEGDAQVGYTVIWPVSKTPGEG